MHKHTLTRICVIVFLSDYFSRIVVFVCQNGGFNDDDDDDDDENTFTFKKLAIILSLKGAISKNWPSVQYILNR